MCISTLTSLHFALLSAKDSVSPMERPYSMQEQVSGRRVENWVEESQWLRGEEYPACIFAPFGVHRNLFFHEALILSQILRRLEEIAPKMEVTYWHYEIIKKFFPSPIIPYPESSQRFSSQGSRFPTPEAPKHLLLLIRRDMNHLVQRKGCSKVFIQDTPPAINKFMSWIFSPQRAITLAGEENVFSHPFIKEVGRMRFVGGIIPGRELLETSYISGWSKKMDLVERTYSMQGAVLRL